MTEISEHRYTYPETRTVPEQTRVEKLSALVEGLVQVTGLERTQVLDALERALTDPVTEPLQKSGPEQQRVLRYGWPIVIVLLVLLAGIYGALGAIVMGWWTP